MGSTYKRAGGAILTLSNKELKILLETKESDVSYWWKGQKFVFEKSLMHLSKSTEIYEAKTQNSKEEETNSTVIVADFNTLSN